MTIGDWMALAGVFCYTSGAILLLGETGERHGSPVPIGLAFTGAILIGAALLFRI